MRSSNRQYLGSVDHLRGFAALLVVFYHASVLITPRLSGKPVVGDHQYSTNPLLTAVYEGHSAVTLFMVLSGFIFTVGTLGHGVSFPRFMANRLLRIYPLFLLLVVLGTAFALGSFSVGGLFLTVTGLGNYPGALNLGSVSAMFWAVAVEMQFYLLFPLLNKILSKAGLSTFVRLLAAVIVVRGLVWFYSAPRHDPMDSLYYNLAGRIDDFLIGMIAAWFFVHHRARFRGWWKVAVSVLIAGASLWELNQVHGLGSTANWRLGWVDWEAAMWGLVILTYVATLRSDNAISRVAARVGEMSFSIYLLHFLLIQIVMKHHWYVRVNGVSDAGNALLTALLVVTPVLLAISVVTYQGVERPFLRLRMRYLVPLDETGPAAAERTPPGDAPTYRPQHEATPAIPAPNRGANGHRDDAPVAPEASAPIR